MTWYRYFVLAAFILCVMSLLYHVARLVRMGAPRDYSIRKGNVGSTVAYSFIGAMNPARKESAYLHLPTYTAGVIYHIGTFASLVLALFYFFSDVPGGTIRWILAGLLSVSVLCGIAIFIKRLLKKNIRSLSNADDYIANFLVTIFQLVSLSMLVTQSGEPLYFFVTGLLLFYAPVGKLKHALYFFMARYHLGLFYGWRGVWPLRSHN